MNIILKGIRLESFHCSFAKFILLLFFYPAFNIDVYGQCDPANPISPPVIGYKGRDTICRHNGSIPVVHAGPAFGDTIYVQTLASGGANPRRYYWQYRNTNNNITTWSAGTFISNPYSPPIWDVQSRALYGDTIFMRWRVTDGDECTVYSNEIKIICMPREAMDIVNSITVCSNDIVPATNFTQTYQSNPPMTFNWVADNNYSAIGLSPNGTGNIAAFQSNANNTAAPITTQITVTPYIGKCIAMELDIKTFNITVNPTPTLSTIASTSACHGTKISDISLSGVATRYHWEIVSGSTGDHTTLGLTATSGDITATNNAGALSFTNNTSNTGATTKSVTIRVTPYYENGGANCAGSPQTFTLIVNPQPTLTVTGAPTAAVCHDEQISNISLSGAATKYHWEITSGSSTLLGLNNTSGDIPATSNAGTFAFNKKTSNTTGTPQNGTIKVTPYYDNCTGTPQTFTITVNPQPEVTIPVNASQTVCGGASINAVTFGTPISGATVSYEWTATGDWSSISTGSSSGTGNFPGFTAKANTSGVGYVATITVKPKIGNCYGAQKSFTLTVNPKPALSVDATPVSCYGGSDGKIEITASGGTPSYEYKLNNGIYQTGKTFTVSAGTYTVTVKDAKGCEETTQIVVSQPSAALDASPGVTNILCFGGDGEIKITASGGTPAYEYSIDGGSSYQIGNTFSVKAGTYSVKVKDANGCTKTLTGIAVTQQSAMDISHIVTNVSCYGGSDGTITITASGGISPYEYKLGSGSYQSGKTFTVPAGTNYTVTVKDYNGCEKILTLITVTQPPAALDASPGVTNVPCYGGDGEIKIAATGGTSPYEYKLGSGSYQSGNTFTVKAGTNYTVTVKDDKGCTKTLTGIAVAQPPVIDTTSTVITNASCNGAADGTIKINATGGAVPYQYSLNGGSYQPANTFTAVVSGTYSVTVKDANDCTATFGNLTVAELSVSLTPSDVSASAVCSGQPAIITIANTRPGVLYDAYDAPSGGTKKGSGTGGNGTAIDVNVGVISASTIFYVEAVEGTCISAPRVPVTVSIDKNAVNYPDIVVRVCPNVSAVNLSKYLDTTGLPTVVWKGLSINSSTGVIGAIPSHGVYTYKYSVMGCESTPLQRIVYLHVVSNDKAFFLRDTVAVCWEQAEALQINQMFGIEAPGVWTTIPDLMTSAYIRQTPVGAVIFNGTAAYQYAAGAEALPIITYQGASAKAIEFYYTVPAGCLTKEYKVVIVLTEN